MISWLFSLRASTVCVVGDLFVACCGFNVAPAAMSILSSVPSGMVATEEVVFEILSSEPVDGI